MDLGTQILRILCAVVEENSFSGAARRLKITQPTVSQQIARLEFEIDGKIFERRGKQIHLTTIGEKLYKTAKEIVTKADLLKSEILDHRLNPEGPVRYAMPESCQWTPSYRKIMSLISQYPQAQVEIVIATNKKIQEMLQRSEIDFAFVTGQVDRPEGIIQKFADEQYSLVANSEGLFEPIVNQQYDDLRLISYPGHESFFITWADSYGFLTELRQSFLRPAVRIGNMLGAIHAAIEGAGVLIIPTHCVAQEIETGRLQIYKAESPKAPSQPVYLIKREQEILPKRCQILLDILLQIKRSYS